MFDMASTAPVLTEEQVAAYHRDGYLVVPGWWDAPTIAALKARMVDVMEHAELPPSKSVFTTDEQQRHSDEYFLKSGDNISVFLEEKALDAEGKLTVPLPLAINKVGHNIHELLDEFKAVSFDTRLADVCRLLGFERPVIPQSMYICKQPGIGGAVRPHQDGCFLYTRPQTCVGFWWPLEDCKISNGCLWGVPGSHKIGVHRHFKRRADGKGTEFEPPEAETFDLTGAVPLEMPAGSLVIIHGAVVHYSEENPSPRSRHAYSIHVVEAGKGVVYPADNWLQRAGGAPFPDLYPEFRPGDAAGAATAPAAAAAAADTAAPAASAPASGAGTA